MKKIVPFNNILEFNTDVCEITSISLEHKLDVSDDMISGVFYITGEYKITDGQLERDKFSFELPFDIALGNSYDRDTLVIDIDDFRYDIVDNNKLKVNIDLYIDGKEVVIDEDKDKDEDLNSSNLEKAETSEELEMTDNVLREDEKTSDEIIEPMIIPSKEKITLLDEMLDENEEKIEMKDNIDIDNNNENNNENVNIFNSFENEEKYVTYRVYKVIDGDTVDKIIEKYNVSKEELEKYNNIADIKIGDNLIIPANDK